MRYQICKAVSRLNISMAVRCFSPKGGAEKFSLDLARHLCDQGHRVRVLAIRADSLEGVEVVRVPMPRTSIRASRDWQTGAALSRALRHEQADITWSEQKTWGAMMLRPGGGVEREYWKARAHFQLPGIHPPAVFRRYGLKRFFDFRSEQNAYRHPALRMVIVNSHMVKEHCLQHYPNLSGRVEVVHNGSEAPDSSPSTHSHSRATLLEDVHLDANRTTALFLGHDYARKGLATTLEGLKTALHSKPDLPLQILVAGRGRTQPYRKLAEKLGVATRVGFAQTQYASEDLMQASDFLALPSFFDSFANVTVEALSAGLPVVTAKTNGAHEILTHGKDSYILSDPHDIERMAGHFLTLCEPTSLSTAQHEARQTATRYRLKKQLSKIEQHMLNVASPMNNRRREPSW